MNRILRRWRTPALAALLFLIPGLALLPWPGLQNDEVFFSGPLYYPDGAYYAVPLGTMKIPFMVMSYSGALKTWLYAAIFQAVAPNEWSVRLPVLLMGVGTVWLTWVWVRRLAGPRAAAVATLLLATDSIFLLTDLFDWGPVAIQHLLLMSGLVALQAWLRNSSRWVLTLAFFLWGLGMWDKALMIWPLTGLAVATISVFPRDALRLARPAVAAVALGSFLLGAAPLVWYNIARPAETATANAKPGTQGLQAKITVLSRTFDGSALFGYLVNPGRTGGHRRNGMIPAALLSLLCVAAAWRTWNGRWLLFLAIAMVVEWLQMALNQGTGGSSHHVILLWPLPLVFIGIAFASAAEKFPRYGFAALALVTGFLAIENLLTTGEYLKAFAANGASVGWTDAIEPLGEYFEKHAVGRVGIVDWGYLNQLRMRFEGDLPLFLADSTNIEGGDRLYVQHTSDKQIFPGVNDRLRQAAAEKGFTEDVVQVIHDRKGRPVFEIFRFEKKG